MKFKFISFSICILFASCFATEIEKPFNEIEVPKDHVLVKYSKPDEKINSYLRAMGNEIIGNFNFSMNTDNSHYTLYSATVQRKMKPFENGVSSSDGSPELLSLKLHNGCFIYNLTKDDTAEGTYEKELANYSLIFDRKLPNVLNNDSIYFSINGIDVHTLGAEGSISSYPTVSNKTVLWSDNQLIPLFNGSINEKGKLNEYSTSFQIGFFNYDCEKNYDFDKFFNSQIFLSCVGIPKHIMEDEEINELLALDNYIIE